MKPIKIFSPAAMFCLMIAILTSCEDIFQYNSNEVLLEEDEKNLNAKNIHLIEALPARDTLRFIVIADVHHNYEVFENFTEIANNLHDIAFVAVAGDLTSFGLQTEYRELHAILKKLHMPWVCVIGNHDLLGNGRKVYHEMFGALNFTFLCNGNKFICIDSNSREYNFNGQVPDLAWLNHEIGATDASNIFIISHIAPFDHDFDPALENGYVSALASTEKVRISLHGHWHDFYKTYYYNDGILYQVTDDLADRGYTLISVWNEGFNIEQIRF